MRRKRKFGLSIAVKKVSSAQVEDEKNQTLISAFTPKTTNAMGRSWEFKPGAMLRILSKKPLNATAGRASLSLVTVGAFNADSKTPSHTKQFVQKNYSSPEKSKKIFKLIQDLGLTNQYSPRHIIRPYMSKTAPCSYTSLRSGTLSDLIPRLKPYLSGKTSKENKQFALTFVFRAMQKILGVHGIQHAHKNNKVHLDMKPENILVDVRENKIKIADIESTLPISDLSKPEIVPESTHKYLSPERILGPDSQDIQSAVWWKDSDIYALGITFRELLSQLFSYCEPKDGDNELVFAERQKEWAKKYLNEDAFFLSCSPFSSFGGGKENIDLSAYSSERLLDRLTNSMLSPAMRLSAKEVCERLDLIAPKFKVDEQKYRAFVVGALSLSKPKTKVKHQQANSGLFGQKQKAAPENSAVLGLRV
jgi:serine/threonine protein kinase